jgi:hypothetical protein
MIARINIAVVLHRQSRSARLAEDAQTRSHARPAAERHVKHLDKGCSDITAYPFVEDGGKEGAVILAPNTPIGDGRTRVSGPGRRRKRQLIKPPSI